MNDPDTDRRQAIGLFRYGLIADLLQPTPDDKGLNERLVAKAALDYTKENYYGVAHHYPGKSVVITEAGWTTSSNGRGIEPWNASQELQAIYYRKLVDWTREAGILTFVFEAFDEPWKGSADPLEPEKHWGLFTMDRMPKLALQDIYADRVSN